MFTVYTGLGGTLFRILWRTPPQVSWFRVWGKPDIPKRELLFHQVWNDSCAFWRLHIVGIKPQDTLKPSSPTPKNKTLHTPTAQHPNYGRHARPRPEYTLSKLERKPSNPQTPKPQSHVAPCRSPGPLAGPKSEQLPAVPGRAGPLRIAG